MLMIVQQTIERTINAVVDIVHVVRNSRRRVLICAYRTFTMDARCQCKGGRDVKAAWFSDHVNSIS